MAYHWATWSSWSYNLYKKKEEQKIRWSCQLSLIFEANVALESTLEQASPLWLRFSFHFPDGVAQLVASHIRVLGGIFLFFSITAGLLIVYLFGRNILRKLVRYYKQCLFLSWHALLSPQTGKLLPGAALKQQQQQHFLSGNKLPQNKVFLHKRKYKWICGLPKRFCKWFGSDLIHNYVDDLGSKQLNLCNWGAPCGVTYIGNVSGFTFLALMEKSEKRSTI